MELSEVGRAGWAAYFAAYDVLIGDRRTAATFRGIVEGIVAGRSLLAARIARFSPSVGGGEACGAAGATDGA